MHKRLILFIHLRLWSRDIKVVDYVVIEIYFVDVHWNYISRTNIVSSTSKDLTIESKLITVGLILVVIPQSFIFERCLVIVDMEFTCLIYNNKIRNTCYFSFIIEQVNLR